MIMYFQKVKTKVSNKIMNMSITHSVFLNLQTDLSIITPFPAPRQLVISLYFLKVYVNGIINQALCSLIILFLLLSTIVLHFIHVIACINEI